MAFSFSPKYVNLSYIVFESFKFFLKKTHFFAHKFHDVQLERSSWSKTYWQSETCWRIVYFARFLCMRLWELKRNHRQYIIQQRRHVFRFWFAHFVGNCVWASRFVRYCNEPKEILNGKQGRKLSCKGFSIRFLSTTPTRATLQRSQLMQCTNFHKMSETFVCLCFVAAAAAPSENLFPSHTLIQHCSRVHIKGKKNEETQPKNGKWARDWEAKKLKLRTTFVCYLRKFSLVSCQLP